jgi:hypothetical protein
MLSRILTAGTLAGTTLLSPLASPAGAEDTATKAVAPDADTEHCITNAAGAAARAVAQVQETCFPTLAEARAVGEARGQFLIATHWKKPLGEGEYHHEFGTSCVSTWQPAGTWPGTLSSTRVSDACTGAKHYTNANCSGSYQIVSGGSLANMNAALDNNVGCVKYT